MYFIFFKRKYVIRNEENEKGEWERIEKENVSKEKYIENKINKEIKKK